jgi:hypothetical protein
VLFTTATITATIAATTATEAVTTAASAATTTRAVARPITGGGVHIHIFVFCPTDLF